MATPSVGCRVRILKDYATVRYIGPVAKQEGTWVGVEWDDPSRGKHDGSTGGIRYFECKASGNAGSFVRIERVSFGVSVLEALRARYNNETAEHGEEVKEDELYVHTSRNRRVRVQLVGEEKIQQKQRQIHALESARLVGLDVAFVDAASALSSSLPALTSLDLTCNLLTNWAAVEQLATALPNLSALNLSENRIQIQIQIPTAEQTAEEQKETVAGEVQPAASTQNTEPSAGEAAAALAPVPAAATAATTATALPPQPPAPRRGVLLPGLRVLVLNDCGISWQDVLQVAPQLPSLQELHCCGNSIPSLHPAPHHLRHSSSRASTAAAAAATTTTPPALPPTQQEAEGQQPLQQPQQQATVINQEDGSPQQQPQPQQQGQVQEGDGSGGEQAANDVQSECDDEAGGNDDEAAAELLASLFPRLQVLTLEEVGLRGWSQLLPLRRLPALTRLHLAGNPRITHVRYPDAAAAAAVPAAAAVAAPGAAAATESQPSTSSPSASDSPAAAVAAAAPDPTTAAVPAAAAAAASVSFPRLTALFLGGCGIADWGSVDQLDRFPELKEVRLTGNPVLALSRTGGRFEVIGRVSRLRHLNGAEVRPRERRDSELRYLQHIAAEMEAAAAAGDETSRAAVRAAHPRLRALMEVYGSVLATAARGGPGGPGGSLAASTVELKLTCVAAAAQAKMGTQVKKLPRTTTVSALRLLCERLFKVPADRMALFLRAPGDPLPEDLGGSELEDRPLAFFGVQAGYEVLVDEVDPGEVRAAGERSRQQAAAAHEQRLAEQLRAAERMQAEVARNMGAPQQQQ
ncbi:hypothetical protein Agub_g10665 [Astrephomene gubernaculifera]|uniref:CAP-Gly domain-containing protein n=1 Tax=Astrephomene gubernaculifera TaxID=47775 RepID=A0AAD3HP82_9CHLO|nr:hypothetical protein Agub_g10665 [Astrephomene gubernaculifera]